MPTYFQRPENALKRANEFIDVGKKQRALDALYDVIKSKKHRTWQKIHEPIMNKYLELCVELKKSHIAKEGLFQYRNICQQVNIKSLEDVVRMYLQLAEEKTEAAREESQIQAVADIDDLDNLTTPESLLLSAVSGEDAQDRTDRVVLTPWVKFLWESYRQCLELLRNNSRVERLYHDIAQQAFRFCLKYIRKTEFRKLCDNLRTHLSHIHKHQNQQTAINLNNLDSQAMHLETRLCQLDSAIQMELWQEAYKAIEDIHGLMNLSKKPPKPQLMANYYQKLALVFWKAGNFLFHASALFRLFHHSRDLKKNMTTEEIQRMASRVLLATLAIPIPPSRNEIDKYLETDENTMDKQRRLAMLLGLTNPPHRAQLIKDLARYNVLQYTSPQLQELYRWLELEFHPLRLCARVQHSFDYLQKSEDIVDLQQYIPALQDVTLMRLLKQVSQVYQTILFSRLLELAPFTSAFHLERVVVDAARNNDLQVRIDHRTKCLNFGMDLNVAQREDVPEGPHLQSMPSEQIRNQLVMVSSVLHRTIHLIQPPKLQAEKTDLRHSVVTAYLNTAKKKHVQVLARRQIIEERKELLENLNIQREEEERRLLEEQRRKQLLLEEERLQREADERERQRRVEEHKEIKRKHVKDKIEQLKKTGYVKFFQELAEEELEKLDADEIMARQVEQLDKERKELQVKLKTQEKKVDYLERAKRQDEIPLLQHALEERQKEEKLFWEDQEQERIKQMLEDRKIALEHRERLSRLVIDKDIFMEKLRASRVSVYQTKLSEFEIKLQEERKKRLLQRKEDRKKDRILKKKEEREAEKQRKQEEEMKRIHEAEEREREEKRVAELAAELLKKEAFERVAAKQKAREQEIEEKRRREEEEARLAREKERDVVPRRKDEDSWRRKEDRGGPDPGPGEKSTAPWRSVKEGGSVWRQREKDRQESWCPPRDNSDSREPESSWRASEESRPSQEPEAEKPPPRREDESREWRRGGPEPPQRDRDRRDDRGQQPSYRDSDRSRGDRDDERYRSDKDDMRRAPPRDDNKWRRDDKPPREEMNVRRDEPAREDSGAWRRRQPENDWRHDSRHGPPPPSREDNRDRPSGRRYEDDHGEPTAAWRSARREDPPPPRREDPPRSRDEPWKADPPRSRDAREPWGERKQERSSWRQKEDDGDEPSSWRSATSSGGGGGGQDEKRAPPAIQRKEPFSRGPREDNPSEVQDKRGAPARPKPEVKMPPREDPPGEEGWTTVRR